MLLGRMLGRSQIQLQRKPFHKVLDRLGLLLRGFFYDFLGETGALGIMVLTMGTDPRIAAAQPAIPTPPRQLFREARTTSFVMVASRLDPLLPPLRLAMLT